MQLNLTTNIVEKEVAYDIKWVIYRFTTIKTIGNVETYVTLYIIYANIAACYNI